jgi:hypothetical protein
VVVQHDHRAVSDRQPPERTLQLIAVSYGRDVVESGRFVDVKDPEVGRPAPGLLPLGVAGTHAKAVRPPFEACGVAKLRKVPPDGEQRLLRRIVGEVGVAKDPVSDRVQPVPDDDSEARQSPLVTALRLHDQLGGIHAAPVMSARPVRAHLQVYGSRDRLHNSICSMLPGNGVCDARN